MGRRVGKLDRIGLGARYFLTERLSLGLRGLFIDTGDEWAAGLRFQF
jgi:hypothetical protein